MGFVRKFIVFLVTLAIFDSLRANDFTARAFCEDPWKFVCETSNPMSDPVIQARINGYVEFLKAKFPSFRMFIEDELKGRVSLSQFMELNTLMENYARRKFAETLIQEESERISRLSISEVLLNGGFNTIEENRLKKLRGSALDVYKKVPDDVLWKYTDGILKSMIQEMDERRAFEAKVFSASPVLRAIDQDFNQNSRAHMWSVGKNLQLPMRGRVEQDSLARLPQFKMEFQEQKKRMIEYLENESSWHMKGVLLTRAKSIEFGELKDSDRIRCWDGSFIGHSGSYLDKKVNYCHGQAALFSGSTFHDRVLFSHEFSHGMDNFRMKSQYSEMHKCIKDNYTSKINLRGEPLARLPEELVNRAITFNMPEWIADSFAASYLAFNIKKDKVSESQALAMVQMEYKKFCRKDAYSAIGPIHPPTRTRIEILATGNRDIREIFRCDRFPKAVPLNKCPHFMEIAHPKGEEPQYEMAP